MFRTKTSLWLLLLSLNCILFVVYKAPIYAKPFYAKPSSVGRLAYAIAWSPDSVLVAVGYSQGDVEIIDADMGVNVSEFSLNYPIRDISWSTDGSKLAIATDNHEIQIRDINGNLLWQIADLYPVGEVEWTADDKSLLITEHRSTSGFRVWDIINGQFVYSDDVPTVTDIVWNSDKSQFAISCLTPYLEIRDANSFERREFLGLSQENILALLSTNQPLPYNLLNANWSPNDKYIIAGSTDGKIIVWDTRSKSTVYETYAPQETLGPESVKDNPGLIQVKAIWFNKTGALFSSLAGDGTYRVWDASTGMLLNDIYLVDQITLSAISPSRMRLAYVNTSQQVIIRNLPLANAGPNQTLTDPDGNGIERVTLDATASTDSDGSIVSYEWRLDGASIATGPNPQVELPSGAHTITLSVTDNDGLVDTDEVVVTVRGA